MSLSALAIAIAAGVSGSIGRTDELNILTSAISEAFGLTFALGTGANQANGMYTDTNTLADDASITLDFSDSSLSGPLAEAIDFAILKALVIKNDDSAAGLIIGNAAATQLGIFGSGTHTLLLPPGGVFIWTAPDATGLDVTTNDALKLTHDGTGAATLSYDIVALGVQT